MEEKKKLFENLINRAKEIIQNKYYKIENLMELCTILRDNVMYYDWVGFYMVNPIKRTELLLGPFAGPPTEHVKIPFGKGICGQAAESKSTFVVQNVSNETNYLSCSPFVKSEIVVPIIKNEKIVGELDIDSHNIAPFTVEDREFLEEICKLVSNNLF